MESLMSWAGPHLPVLLVITPLFGGLLCSFTRGRELPWFWATLVTGTACLWATLLLMAVQASPAHVVSYPIGWWPPEYGIEYRVDPVNAWVILIVAGIAFVATFYARLSVLKEIPNDRLHFFYAVWLLQLAGLLGISVTGDAFNVYVLLEIGSLTAYALISMGKNRDRRALTASIRYLILGSIGATFILLGIGYLIMLTGTLNMADMHTALLEMKARGELANNRTLFVSFAFLMVGLSLKMALFPLHLWLPNAYSYAPSAVSAFMSATATKVGVYMAVRFYFTVFSDVFDDRGVGLMALIFCASVGVMASGIRAIAQRDAKRTLAFSSVGQLAYIAIGFSLANVAGVAAAMLHLFNHALIKGGMFMALGNVSYRTGSTQLEALAGLGKRMPLTAAAFTAGGLGLVGVPLTAGFVSKWYLVQGAMERGMWWLALVVLAGSLLALLYVWQIVEAMYFKEPHEKYKDMPVEEAPLGLLLPTWILIGASIWFGINAVFSGEAAEAAARALLGVN